jgi:hypothetical protein
MGKLRVDASARPLTLPSKSLHIHHSSVILLKITSSSEDRFPAELERVLTLVIGRQATNPVLLAQRKQA